MRKLSDNLNIRVDELTTKRLSWLSIVTNIPKSLLVRILIKRAKPSDFGVDGIPAQRTKDALHIKNDENGE